MKRLMNYEFYLLACVVYYSLVLITFALITWNLYVISRLILILIIPFLGYAFLILIFKFIEEVNKGKSKRRKLILRMYGLTVDFFASVIAVTTVIMIVSFITTDKFNILEGIGSLYYLISNTLLEAQTNSILISIVLFYITAFYLYKKVISSYYLIIGKCFKWDSVQILKESLSNKKLLADYTLIAFSIGILPLFIKWIGVEDNIAEKIGEHSFVIASSIIIPYFNLLYRDDLN